MRDYRPKSPPTCYDAKPGRPRKNLYHSIHPALTEEQWNFLCSECEKLHITKSEYIRMLLDDMMSIQD